MLKNTTLIEENDNNLILTILNKKIENTFQLKVKNKDFLTNGQTIAVLKEDTYKTTTGGIICYDIEGNRFAKKRRSTKKIFSGSLYWIPEETYILNSSLLESLKVKPGNVIKKGTEIWPGNFTKLGGLVQFDDFTQELTIRPGELFILNDSKYKKFFE